MKIDITQRLRPFSHLPGVTCWVPGTTWGVKVYPALINFFDINDDNNEIGATLSLNVLGPVEDFTVFQDLERGCITVEGHTLRGFMRYHVYQSDGSLKVFVENEPKENIFIDPIPGFLSFDIKKPVKRQGMERIFLGVDKKLDWEMVIRRFDLRELFPICLCHELWAPVADNKSSYSFLDALCQKILSTYSPDLEKHFEKVFRAFFYGIMIPRLKDDDHQGISFPKCDNSELSSMAVLHQVANASKKLFIRYDDDNIAILPNLPSLFHSGRYINISCDPYGVISMEWTKKRVRRLVFCCKKDCTLNFSFQKDLKTFRLRSNPKDKGQRKICGESLIFFSGKKYMFDNFEK